MAIFKFEDLSPKDRVELLQRFQRFAAISEAINDDFKVNAVEAQMPLPELLKTGLTYEKTTEHWKSFASSYERQAARHQDAADQLNEIGNIIDRNKK